MIYTIKNLFNFKKLLTWGKPDIRRSLPLINRLNMPFDLDIRGGSTVFRRSAKTFEINFVSTLRREIVLKLLISRLYLPFFN